MPAQIGFRRKNKRYCWHLQRHHSDKIVGTILVAHVVLKMQNIGTQIFKSSAQNDVLMLVTCKLLLSVLIFNAKKSTSYFCA